MHLDIPLIIISTMNNIKFPTRFAFTVIQASSDNHNHSQVKSEVWFQSNPSHLSVIIIIFGISININVTMSSTMMTKLSWWQIIMSTMMTATTCIQLEVWWRSHPPRPYSPLPRPPNPDQRKKYQRRPVVKKVWLNHFCDGLQKKRCWDASKHNTLTASK